MTSSTGRALKKLLLFSFLTFLSFGCGGKPTPEPTDGPSLHILFLGNSYTYVNDLPKMLCELAKSGRHELTTQTLAPGGWTLTQHANDPQDLQTIADGKWDFVVLQEQSVVPSLDQERGQRMYPSIRTLDIKIKLAEAKSLLYLTWGRKNGFPDGGFQDYGAMQYQLTKGYLGIATELGIEVAPVGVAWQKVHETQPDLELWGEDGSHPSLEGTYLAACVFYSVLYRKSPEGLKYFQGIPEDRAGFLQKIAAGTVLTDPAQWNLP